MGTIIEAKDVRNEYVVGSTVINALNGVNLRLKKGSLSLFWALVELAKLPF